MLHLRGLDQLTTVSLGDELNFCSKDIDDAERNLGSYKSNSLAESFLCNNSLSLRSIHLSVQHPFLARAWSRLESLTLKDLYGINTYQNQLSQAMAAGLLKNLHSLSLVNAPLEDRHLVIILGTMASLQ